MENPIKMDDFGGFPLFLETPIYNWREFFEPRQKDVSSEHEHEG